MPEYRCRKEAVDAFGDDTFEFNPDEGERVVDTEITSANRVTIIIGVPVEN